MKKILYLLMISFIIVLSGCQKEAINEQLPEYCRTYSGFTDTASKDLFELLDENGHAINRYNYQTVISEIELSFEKDDPYKDIDLSGLQCFQNLTSLSLRGRSFKDISPIRELHNIQSLELRNTSVVSVDSFKGLSKINNLVINGTKTLQNVEGVSEMTKLTTLDLSGNGLVNIGELNQLVNLRHLYVNDNQIMKFPSINNLINLETLDISNNQINELGDDLSGLSSLVQLNASHNEICDISAFGDLESLEILDLSFNDLGCLGIGTSPNFDSLENAQKLRILKLNDNNLSSIEGLRNRNIFLEVLDLRNNQIQDLTPIAEYKNIKELYLSNNNITNISNLSGMTGLTEIDLSNNQITDFSNLLSIPNVTTVNLANNLITNIPNISSSWSSLSVLDLHSNYLTDISGIKGHQNIESLILYNNGLTTISGISNLPQLDELVIVSDYENEIPIEDQRPNVISVINDSFNDVPSLKLSTEHVLDLPFNLGNNIQILNSFNNIPTISTIDFSNLDIDIIDNDSLNLPNLAILNVSGNNLTDLSFILGNPNLVYLDISDNLITDISVISSDENLAELQVLYANNNNITQLNNALNNLPSLEEVYLTNNPIQLINNSFTSLPRLTSMIFETGELTEVIGSFRALPSIDQSSSNLYWDSGKIETISDSFIDCKLDNFFIKNQTPVNPVTVIEDSFHNLNLNQSSTISISNSNFKTITNSFNQITLGAIIIDDAFVSTINGSFSDATIDSLQITNNLLTDLPGLNQVNSLQALNLDDNQFSTVAFVDGINGLEELSIKRQTDNFDQPTLLTIDGINNVPNLSSLSIDKSGIQTIDGFKNTNLSIIDLSVTALNGGEITFISDQSFVGSPITNLDLSGNQLSSIDFLQNLTEIEVLSIGLNMADISFMQGLPMEDTLTSLTFDNVTSISDFSALSSYDAMRVLSLPNNTVNIQNLDGMQQLQEVRLDETVVTTITDSFNNMPKFSFVPGYFDSFSSLVSITRSFDLVGINESTGQVDISTSFNIIDSFHNAKYLRLYSDTPFTTLPFDTSSFTSLTDLFIQKSDLISYTNLTGYSSLNNLIVDTLYGDIIDLTNTSISSITINFTTSAVSQVNVNIADEGSVSFSSLKVGSIVFETNASTVELDTPNLSVNFTTNAPNLELTSNASVMSITGNSLEQLAFGDMNVNTMNITSPALSSAVLNPGSSSTFTSLQVNTDASSLHLNVDANTLTINDNSLININLDNSGNTSLYNSQTTLSAVIYSDNFAIYNDLIETIDFTSGNVTNLFIDSNAIQSVTGNLNVGTLDLTSNVNNITLSMPNMQSGQLQAVNLTTLEAVLNNGDLSVQTGQNALNLTDASTLNELDLSLSTAINDLTLGNATVSTVLLSPVSANLSLTAVKEIDFVVDTTTVSSLNIDTPLSNITMNGSASSLYLTANAGVVAITSPSLQDINIDSTTLQTLTLVGGSNLDNVQSNTSIINTLDITTDAILIDLSTQNVLSTSITGDLLQVVNADVSSNDLELSSSNSTLSASLVANNANLQLNASSVTISDITNVSNLALISNPLTSVSMGNATVNNATISNNVDSLNIYGTNVAAFTIDSTATTISVITGITNNLIVNSSAVSPVTISTTSTSINVSGNVDTIISSSTLDQVNIQLQNQTLTLDLAKPSLSLALSGEADTVNITGDDFTELSMAAGTNINTLNITASNLSLFDSTGVTITNLSLETNNNSFNLTTPNTGQIVIGGSNLNNIIFTAPVSDLTINSSATSLSLSGDASSLLIQNDTITLLDASLLSVSDLTIDAASLTSLTIPASAATNAIVSTSATNFDITSNVSDITVNNSGNITMHVPTASTISFTTDANLLDVNAIDSTINVNAPRITSLVGQASTVNLSTISVDSLIVDYLGTINITYEGTNPYTVNFANAEVASVNLANASSLTLTGQLTDLLISGNNINTLDTSSLIATSSMIVNDTTFTTLSFASDSLLSSLSTLTINTLDVNEIETILTELSGYNLTLYSPITESDIETYYFNTKYTELVAQEEIDNARYDSFYQNAVNQSVSLMLANIYLNHYGETEIRNQIVNDSLLTIDEYFNQYLVSEGLTIADVTSTEETAIKATIQATIDEVTSLIDPINIQNQVISSITDDANTYATNQLISITFTIG